ncbi:MAG: trehalase family glycosidase [Bacteroidota bacterium]
MPADLSEDDLPQVDPEAVSMAEHLGRHWRVLFRKPDLVRPHDTLVPLPAPYVVPGGRFREVYYWDTYFTMRGLAVSGRMDLVRSLIANAAHLIAAVGHVPNGNRTYYLHAAPRLADARPGRAALLRPRRRGAGGGGR